MGRKAEGGRDRRVEGRDGKEGLPKAYRLKVASFSSSYFYNMRTPLGV